MPKFIARLEAQDDSGHFRRVAIEADSKEQAKDQLERREMEYVLFGLTTDDLAEAEKDPGTPRNRAALALHNQTKPYKLVSVKESD